VRIRALLAARWMLAGWLAAGCVAAAAPAAGEGPAPVLARSRWIGPGETKTRGLVFFLRIESGAGAAAVGSAASFDRSELARARRVEFRAGPSRQLIATSQALLTPPGWPGGPGASAASPHLVYALDASPDGVTLLQPSVDPTPPAGTRIRVLGLAADSERLEERFGRILSVTPERFEIEVEPPALAKAWAGAPVLLAAGGALIGTLEPGLPGEPTRRAGVTPILFLVRELTRPLEHGAGRPFARFAAPAFAMAPPGAKLIQPSEPRTTRVQLDVSLPTDASRIPPTPCGVFVAGRARASSGGLRGFDVVIVIDTSLSTIEPTGADVNGNGTIGSPYLGPISSLFDAAGDDPGDSILAAEVAAARRLLHELDPRSTRVALVTFAGELEPVPARFLLPGSPPPAITREPLTRKFGRIERALDELLASTPSGVTHMAAGVDQATLELLGLPGARSKPDPTSEKVVLFLTDGQPTLPYGPGKDADNVRAVLEAADRARENGIRIHTFAIGPEALAGPIATVELAARTQGYFIPVRDPGGLVDVVEAVHFPDLHDVVVRSATTGAPAHPFRSDADGNFSGLVAAEPGENRIEVVARADDGTAARREITVRLDPAAPPIAIPDELAADRNALLEECLREMQDQRMQAEREQAERVRRELLVEIEREREKARARAAEQRKQLRLEVKPQ
jgi:Mg-chelatase subunit ChlD